MLLPFIFTQLIVVMAVFNMAPKKRSYLAQIGVLIFAIAAFFQRTDGSLLFSISGLVWLSYGLFCFARQKK